MARVYDRDPHRMLVVPDHRPRWWQWPTVLSLDAPIVSITWQMLLAHLAHAAIDGPRIAVLGLSVWLAYAADRWLEGFRLDVAEIRTRRHHFYFRWRRPIAIVWAVVLASDVGLALAVVSSAELLRGLVLLSMVLAYVVSHQYLHRLSRWRAPKELIIAMLLTGGVALFLLGGPDAALAGPLVYFALLCFTNCALISTWEREVDIAQGQTSLALDRTGATSMIRSLPWLIAMLTTLAWTLGPAPTRAAAGCAAVSAVLLGLVDRLERRTGWPLARVLADVVLLTPVVPLLWWAR